MGGDPIEAAATGPERGSPKAGELAWAGDLDQVDVTVPVQIASPQVLRGFVDTALAGTKAVAGPGPRALTRIGLVLLSIEVVGAVTDLLAAYWSQRVAWTATNSLRADLAAHLLRLDLDFFQTHPPGELIERVTPDVLVKGEDYRDKEVVGREWVESHGGEVVLAPLLEGRSTSAILERGGGSPPQAPAGR